ncbi:MAG: mechanosensitive ion channel family protein [Anaerolineales bacterium]|nr:mechanosensitive ion channel family protein [Anaerolineales bacterium]
MDYLGYTFYGNKLETWLIALGIFALSMIALQIIKGATAKRIANWAKQTNTNTDDLIVNLLGRTNKLFFLILSLYFASQILTLPEKVRQADNTITMVAFFVQIGLWGNGFISYWFSSQVQEKSDTDAEGATTMNVLGYVAKVVLWAVVVILALDNIPGVEVDSLIASLGIGGVAGALAVQNILGDLFASLSIALDKPFGIGDYIVVGDYSGTVERIGLNSTRIRSIHGEELIFSNSDLAKSRLSNYKSMTRRRVLFSFRVVSNSPFSKLKIIPAIVQEIIGSHDDVTFDRAHFKDFGDFALIFEVVYYVEGSDYNHYLDIQQSINLAVYQRFEAENIEMAYPTQKIFLQQTE